MRAFLLNRLLGKSKRDPREPQEQPPDLDGPQCQARDNGKQCRLSDDHEGPHDWPSC